MTDLRMDQLEDRLVIACQERMNLQQLFDTSRLSCPQPVAQLAADLPQLLEVVLPKRHRVH